MFLKTTDRPFLYVKDSPAVGGVWLGINPGGVAGSDVGINPGGAGFSQKTTTSSECEQFTAPTPDTQERIDVSVLLHSTLSNKISVPMEALGKWLKSRANNINITNAREFPVLYT